MPPAPANREPIFTDRQVVGFVGLFGTIPGLLVGVATEQLVLPAYASQRNALNSRIDTLQADIATEHAESDVLLRQGQGTSSFAAYLQSKLQEQGRQVTTLQKEVRPFERAHAEYALGCTVLGFIVAAGAVLAKQNIRRWRQRRANALQQPS